MTTNSKRGAISTLLPILFAFLTIGFIGLIADISHQMSVYFHLPKRIAEIIPNANYLWLALLSIPTAIIISRIGRKKGVVMSLIIILMGVLIPLISFTFEGCVMAILLIGIGHVALQVSINPLITNAVSRRRIASTLTLGQAIGAAMALLLPFIALYASTKLGGWVYSLPIYAAVTLVAGGWLLLAKTPQEPLDDTVSLGSVLELLKERNTVLLLIAMVAIAGIDASFKGGLMRLIWGASSPIGSLSDPSTLYMVSRVVGAVVGAVLLLKFRALPYLKTSAIVALIAVATLIFIPSQGAALTLIAVVGFACSTIFALILAVAFERNEKHTSQLSGLLITGMVGGAILPPLVNYGSYLAGGAGFGGLIAIAIILLILSLSLFGIRGEKG